jgi:hypothetical protein
LPQSFLPDTDSLVEAAKFDIRRSHPNKRQVLLRVHRLIRMARSKLRIASSGSPAILWTQPLENHASSPRCHCDFCLNQFWLDRVDDSGRYFVLESENVRQVTLEPVRPDVRARHRINYR